MPLWNTESQRDDAKLQHHLENYSKWKQNFANPEAQITSVQAKVVPVVEAEGDPSHGYSTWPVLQDSICP